MIKITIYGLHPSNINPYIQINMKELILAPQNGLAASRDKLIKILPFQNNNCSTNQIEPANLKSFEITRMYYLSK